MSLTIEKPGALAGATGPYQNDRAIIGGHYQKPRVNAMSKYAQDRHKRAARMVGFALTADDPAIWGQTAAILAHRLTIKETASLAFAALRALEPEARESVIDAAHWGIVQ
jgi:hypothetical protein